MDEIGTNAGTLKLLGGRLSLDFANTADWHASDHPVESLTSYSALVVWSQQVGILTDHQAQHLLKEAARRPEDATAVLGRAIALREAIYRIFSAISLKASFDSSCQSKGWGSTTKFPLCTNLIDLTRLLAMTPIIS